MIGMMEMMTSTAQLTRRQIPAQRAARRAGAPVSIDELTALQVRRNAGLTVDELLRKYRALAPKAVRGRRRIPAVIGRRTLPERHVTADHEVASSRASSRNGPTGTARRSPST
jgi:hypothetical protein